MDIDFTPLIWFGIIIGIVIGAVVTCAVWAVVI